MAEIDGREKLRHSSRIIALQAIYYDVSVHKKEVKKLCSKKGNKLCPQPQEKQNLKGQISSVISKKTENQRTKNKDNIPSYNFVLVFNYADRGLDAALRHDRISDPDRRHLAKQILQDLGEAISELHHDGRIHGDIKPLNIMREGTIWKLIDLDVSCPIGEKYGTKLPSSGYRPPEVANILFTTENLQSLRASAAHDL